MTKITQKQIIESLKELKEIKPRQEWAVLLKSQILTPSTKVLVKVVKEKQAVGAELEIPVPQRQARSVGILDILSSVFAPRKLAYAFAVVLFLIAGVFGFARYTVPGDLLFPVKKIAEQSTASLTGQTKLNQDVVALNNRVNELKQVAEQGKTENIPSAISEVTEMAKDLTNNSVQDPQTIKDIASSLKTLADVPGTDLSQNTDVQDLSKMVVQSEIADLQKTTLTDDQKTILQDVKILYDNGDYSGALIEIYTKLNTNNTK